MGAASPPRGCATTRKDRRDQQGHHHPRQESEPTGVAAVSADGAENRQPLPQERVALRGTTGAGETPGTASSSSRTAAEPFISRCFKKRAPCLHPTRAVGARFSMAGIRGPLGQFIAGCPQLLDPGHGPWGAAPSGTGPPRPLLSPPLWPKSSAAAPGARCPALRKPLTSSGSMDGMLRKQNAIDVGRVWEPASVNAQTPAQRISPPAVWMVSGGTPRIQSSVM